MRTNKNRRELALQLCDLWTEYMGDLGELDAYEVACGQLGIDPVDGWDLLAEFSDEED